MTKIVAIVGQTGVGKTEIAMELARLLGAEIVSADSRQVYRRLDIGSAKPTPAQRAAVPHHVVDVVEPDERFDCARFRREAKQAIDDIARRGKRALVVGGTGLYVKVLRSGLFAGPGRDEALRARLRWEEEARPGALHRRLAAIDPTAAARLHRRDHVRLVRALEVYEASGKPISAWQAEHAFRNADFDVLTIGVRLPRAELQRRIEARCRAMVAAGLEEEIRGLYDSGFDPALPSLRSPGYREIGEHVRGACDLPTAVARMAQATRKLAKRQGTWFRADRTVLWCQPDVERLRERIEAFWA